MHFTKFQDIYELEMAKFMHSFHHKRLPSVFNDYFKYSSLQHNQMQDLFPMKIYIFSE